MGMRVGSWLVLIPLALLCSAGVACQTTPSPEAIPTEAAQGERTLTLIVAELQMYLRDDTYRRPRRPAGGGQDVFSVALWRLDRLQRERAVPEHAWTNVDTVIEYARARALERSRRYLESTEAYARVAARGSLLAETAGEAYDVISRFARHSILPDAFPEGELEWLEERVKKWRELAWEYRGSSYEPLAREEAEAWEMVRVEATLQHEGIEAAIFRCRRLIERYHASKLYPRHLIRLGDLYADAARAEYLRYRTAPRRFDASRYDTYLDRALAAYELAGEQRRAAFQNEAAKKIDALLASHDGVRSHVR